MAILMSVDTIYQDDLAKLKKLNPHAPLHDGKHYLFIKQLPESERSYTTIKVDEWGLSGDELAWKLAVTITADENAVPEADIYTFDALHRHPAWRIWCANYQTEESDNRELFKKHWLYIEDMVQRLRPEAASSWPPYSDAIDYQQGKAIILAAIQANSGG